MMRQRFESALTFAEFLEQAQANAALWRDAYRLVRVPEDAAARLAAIPGRWHFLVMVEDWCGDGVNVLPLLTRLAEAAPNVDLRVIGRDDNADLMDTHLTNGSRSIPVVMVLDEDYEERGWWGPRPSALQQWVMDEGMALEKSERYRRVRTWYARDRGRTIVDEVIDVVARAAGDVGVSAA
ncbi:MAG TPA: thioredoxin family protein [Gemmatimonadaceae bacterium]